MQRRAATTACLSVLVAGAATFAVVGAPAPDRQARKSGGQTAAAALPLELKAAVSSAAGSGQAAFAAERRGRALIARGGGLTTTFRATGPKVELSGGSLVLRLTRVGRRKLAPLDSAAGTAAARNEVSYDHGSLLEWYRNGPFGLEQGFTVARRPAGAGHLRLMLGTSGLLPRRAGSTVVFGKGALVYGGLGAVDARGRTLPATLALSGRRIVLGVDDAGARYPVTIDPFLQAGNRIVAGGEIGNGWFGFRVALSGDGNTALVGGHIDNSARGAAWVFRRSGAIWSQEAKLAPTDEVGGGEFGSSVALSADGTTALVGGRSDDGGKGSAWVFTSNSRLSRIIPWRQQGPKLAPDLLNGERKQFGASVDLTSDGNTAIIGAPLTPSQSSGRGGLGAAWIYARSAGSWTNRSSNFPLMTVFTSDTAQFGASVALAGDGSAALVGAPGYSGGRGSTWYFIRDGQAYLETTKAPVPPSNLSAPLAFGQSLALSEDGQTAVVGAPSFGNGFGYAWVYVHEIDGSIPGKWTQQQGLVATDSAGNAQLGAAIALSADGDTALIGGPQDASGRGAIWAWTRTGTTWNPLGSGKVAAGGEVGSGTFGTNVALAGDGHSAFVGGPKHDGGIGAVWSFGDRPTVTALSPPSGPTTGGTKVTLAGTGFKHASGVKFGSVPATSFEILSPTLLTAVAPPQASATVDVTVSNSGGTSQPTSADRFAYGSGGPPPPPPPAPDSKPPTTAAPLRGSFRAGTLLLRWRASRDNVGVDHYELFRDGVLRKRIAAKVTRTMLARFATRKATFFTLQALDAAKNRSDAATLRVTRRPRPAGVPRTIPRWAQKLYAWESGSRRGARPAAPATLPRWYARWKAWRLQPYKFAP